MHLGLFGLLGRANLHVILKNRGGQGDAIANMVTAEAIVAANPLPEPAPSTSAGRRGAGRPPKRRRGNYKPHEV